MKKIGALMALLIMAGACKKDSSTSSSGKLLLSKVIEDGLLEYEYIYTGEGRLFRANRYSTGSGQSKLSYYFLYEYNDDGSRKQDIQYNDNAATVRQVYTYNAAGKVSRVDRAVKSSDNDNIDDMDDFDVFEYNNKGQLAKITRRETNQTIIFRRQYSYDDEGNLVHADLYVNDNGQMEIRENNEIIPADKQIPEHWKKLMVEPEEMDLYQFFAEEREFTAYWVIPTGKTTHYDYPNRVRNSEGLVTSESMRTMQNGAVIITVDRKYEYLENK